MQQREANQAKKVLVVGATAGCATCWFTGLDADACGALDAVRDARNMPLADEPARVRDDLHNRGA